MIRARGVHTWNGNDIQLAMKRAAVKTIDKRLQQAVLIAKARAPILTGRLVRSIRVLVPGSLRRGKLSGRMGSLLPYANKINLQQREGTGSGYMDDGRASFIGIKDEIKKEWARQVAQNYRISRRGR